MLRECCVPMLLTLVTAGSILQAEISLPALFSDHMVLQQRRPNPIWGWAAPGESITIQLAGRLYRVVANTRGEWRAQLDELPAGGPHRLIVRGRNLIVVEDVMIGEVWLASGQSNMQLSVSATSDAAETLAASDSPQIRLFQVARHSTLEPQSHTPSHWEVCRGSTVAAFSAVAYHFGLKLQTVLGVPVGLINASWGGTNAEEWSRHGELESQPDFAPILDRWSETESDFAAFFRDDLELELWLDDLVFLPSDPEDPSLHLDEFEDGDLVTRFFGSWSAADPGPWGFGRLETVDGEGRALRYSARSRPGTGSHVQVRYGPGRYLDLSRFDALRFRAKGKGFLKFHSLQPTINDWDNYASAVVPLSDQWQTVTVRFRELSQAGWGKREPLTPSRLTGAVFELLPSASLQRPPSGLYNGMIHPLVPYGLKGVLWYQGEGNAGRSHQYRKLLPAMIQSWRSAWDLDRLPFLIVQLPAFRNRLQEPSESGWAELREAQMLTARGDEHAHLAVTIDLGEDDDVHPREKREVGRRLALLAEASVYGRPVVGSGPIFQGFRREGSSIRIEFSSSGSGLVSAGGSRLRGFTIAGEDRRFHPAEARIEGNTVFVNSNSVPEPVAVRYAWADNPDQSLYNREGLPASPFRTDDWPGVTFDRR